MWCRCTFSQTMVDSQKKKKKTLNVATLANKFCWTSLVNTANMRSYTKSVVNTKSVVYNCSKICRYCGLALCAIKKTPFFYPIPLLPSFFCHQKSMTKLCQSPVSPLIKKQKFTEFVLLARIFNLDSHKKTPFFRCTSLPLKDLMVVGDGTCTSLSYVECPVSGCINFTSSFFVQVLTSSDLTSTNWPGWVRNS